jgi:hypothetical protein
MPTTPEPLETSLSLPVSPRPHRTSHSLYSSEHNTSQGSYLVRISRTAVDGFGSYAVYKSDLSLSVRPLSGSGLMTEKPKGGPTREAVKPVCREVPQLGVSSH